MSNSNEKKKQQLGVAHGTARNKLIKQLMFSFVQELGKDICYQCNQKIENIEDFSIEHKIPWLDSEDPKGLFFDLDNIAFSHLKCNVGAARQTKGSHPSRKHYERGCRCDECTKLNTEKVRKYRKNKKSL